MCGLTRSGRIRKDYIRESLGVRNIAGKTGENRLRWFGRVDNDENIGMKEDQRGNRGKK